MDAGIATGSLGPQRSLPPDLLRQSARNVRIASVAIGSIWLLGLVMNDVVFPLWFKDLDRAVLFWPSPGRLIALAGLALTLATFLLAQRASDHHVIELGLVYEVATAALIGVLENWRPSITEMRVSWIAVIIVFYPAIAPASPRKTLVAALLSASMTPLGIALARLRGVEIQAAPFGLIWVILANYIAAAMAVLPAHIIRRLGREVQTARDLGSYRLGEMLGRGGMGEVYLAEHRLLARPAAIKLIRPEVLARGDPDRARIAVERFRREAEAAANLRSAHTIELYDFGVSDDGTFYYVMELLDGVDLEGLVERFGPIPAERAIHLLRQACESLAEAHTRGLMHRDIKPSNIHTCRLGLAVDVVKVLDFGLVKRQPGHPSGEVHLTVPEVTGTPGTPAFMAPETIFGDPTPDHRADLYALGCVGYWLLSGQFVFPAANAAQMLTQHLEAQPQPPSRRTTVEVPAELDAVILACLAKRPDERPASAEDLARRLAACPVRETWTDQRAAEWWGRHLPPGQVLERPAAEGFHVNFAAESRGEPPFTGPQTRA